MPGDTRILVAPVEIAGYYSGLVAGLRTLGSRVEFVLRDDHPFGYESPSRTSHAVRISKRLRHKAQARKRNSIFRVCLAALAESIWMVWAVSACFRYQVFIFGFGQSLMRWNLDLPLLRLLRKRIIINLAHGAEARPPYMGGASEFDLTKRNEVSRLRKQTRQTFRRVRMCERFAHVVIGAPYSTSQFASKPFVNSFVIGLPTKLTHREATTDLSEKALQQLPHAGSKKGTVILHAPSRMRAKGTEEIRRVVAELNSEAINVELREIHGKPNHEVREALVSVGFVVDQLYSDTPLAGLASEAASLGKASVVGGYGLMNLQRFIPAEMFPPSLICQPDSLVGAIEDIVQNPELMQRIGRDAKAFVESKWTCEQVAARFLCLVEDRVPVDWFLSPSKIVYVEGAGQPANVTQERIRCLVGTFGIDALCVSSKPELLKALLDFAFLSDFEFSDE